MKEWWKRKKAKSRKARKDDAYYTKWDLLVDILVWVPEIILLPLRLLFWLLRAVLRGFLDVT